jgi:hypothetical protein
MQLLRLVISADYITAPPDFLGNGSSPGPTDILSIPDISSQKCLQALHRLCEAFLLALSNLLGETHG